MKHRFKSIEEAEAAYDLLEKENSFYRSELSSQSEVILQQKSKILSLKTENESGVSERVADKEKILALNQKLTDEISYLKSLIRVVKKV